MADDGQQMTTDEVREQDRFLPTANISRIMKKSLPPNAKIAKDAKDTTQECVSEFISFITSEASDKCQQEKRKTINGDDLLWAMSTLGFDKYVEPLKLYLQKYRESVKGDKPAAKAPGKKDGTAAAGSAGTVDASGAGAMESEAEVAAAAAPGTGTAAPPLIPPIVDPIAGGGGGDPTLDSLPASALSTS